MTVPDPDVVRQLHEMHIEEPDIVASILAKHGVTLAPADENATDCTD